MRVAAAITNPQRKPAAPFRSGRRINPTQELPSSNTAPTAVRLRARHWPKLLPFSAFVLTYEVAVRLLTDYLNGDTYFHTTYEGQNLIRAKGQLTLAENIFMRLDELSKLSEKYI